MFEVPRRTWDVKMQVEIESQRCVNELRKVVVEQEDAKKKEGKSQSACSCLW